MSKRPPKTKKRPPKVKILRLFYERDEWEGLRSKPGVTIQDTARKES